MLEQPRPQAGRPDSGHRWRDTLWLCTMLLLLAFVVVPLLRDLPFGATTRTGLLAWLLVLLALYWMYAGLGLQPFLLLQLVIFSAAAVLLTAKGILVLVGIETLGVLRRTAKALILMGACLSGLNLLALILVPRWRRKVV